MSRKKPSYLVYLLTFLSLISAISFLCNFFLGLKSLALIPTPEKPVINRENIDRAEFKPSPNTGAPDKGTTTASTGTRYVPPDRGVPSSTAPGGSRGGICEQDQKQDQSIPSLGLTALRPDDSLERGMGLTLESQPQFLVYMPQTSAEYAQFTLKNEQGNNVYQTKEFRIKGQPGIISISLPKNSIQLENNKNYTWYISLICNPQNRAKDVYVTGWIRREPRTDLANKLQNAAARERPKIYAENGIWYEAIANLAELISQNPKDPTLMNDWKTLLESAKIPDIGNKPFSLTKIELPPNLATENR
ncbi:DUF928 domain-containing protein [Floridanema evergladense]|uniref:DUF928 domain-containing protein n=1 Tax=Floridaenema evergladense BLCC-F167 TaxID=3153639 RepID=A0ABV4WQC2_9CYAN